MKMKVVYQCEEMDLSEAVDVVLSRFRLELVIGRLLLYLLKKKVFTIKELGDILFTKSYAPSGWDILLDDDT